ncbi:nicotinate phosphoribosyltransferase, partial [Dehalococcoidia bacterium]|nr:nicotinate phosphoribosyltransferase [Dehalococcoidia bacterium]
MSQSEFDPKPSLMVGDTADIALHRSISVLRNEGVNPVVTMNFTSTAAGVFCGITEIKSLLNKVLPESNRNVWAIQEGSDISDQELVLQVTAPYNSFAVYESAITGIMSHCTGWATASRECVEAAAGVPVISTGSSIVHPHVAGIMDYSAVVGGCVSCTTTLGSKLAGINPSGAISPNVILLIGDAVMAMQNFDKNMPQELPRMAPVNVIKDELEETLALARVMGQRLRGVILDATANVSPTKVKELRARLS